MTIHLTTDQKRALERAAAAEGTSETDLILAGIDAVTAGYRAREPIMPLFKSEVVDLAERADELLEGFGER